MNKPIIVDGCNVTECEYCIIAGAEFPECRIKISSFDIKCENYNCYYKQLQRLKAENEKLKKEVSDLNFYIDSYKITWEIDKKEQYKQTLKNIRELIIPCMAFMDGITVYKTLASIKNQINEVLKDE